MDIFRLYWQAYGGFKALFTSGYFWSAVVITAVLFPRWSLPGWWDDVLGTLPDLLGFTLGGYAIWMAIGDDRFRRLMSQKGEEGTEDPTSYFMEVNAAFVHFVLCQVVALVFALIAQAYSFRLADDHPIRDALGEWLLPVVLIPQGISYLVFVYALLLALAATMKILGVADVYEDYQNRASPGAGKPKP